MVVAFAITKIAELKLAEVLITFAADLCLGEHFQGALKCDFFLQTGNTEKGVTDILCLSTVKLFYLLDL